LIVYAFFRQPSLNDCRPFSSSEEEAPPPPKKKESKKEAKKKAVEAKKKEESKKKEEPKKEVAAKKDESSGSSSSSSDSRWVPAAYISYAPLSSNSKPPFFLEQFSDSEDEKPEAKKAKVEDAKKDESGSSSSDSSSGSDSSDSEDEKEDEGTSNGESKKRKADSALESGEEKKQALDPDANCKVYIRGLPWRATEDEINEFFAECGKIKSIDMPLQDDGRSSGTGEFTVRAATRSLSSHTKTTELTSFFSHQTCAPILIRQAIIEFSDASGAAAALEHNGADFGGRWLNIKYSTSRPIDEARAPSQKEEGCVTVFVGNMSFHIDEDTVRETFKDCGEIANIRFAEDRETGAFKGYGHVEFVESEATDKAVALAGTYVMDRPIRVDFANERRGRSSFGGGDGGGRGGWVLLSSD